MYVYVYIYIYIVALITSNPLSLSGGACGRLRFCAVSRAFCGFARADHVKTRDFFAARSVAPWQNGVF